MSIFPRALVEGCALLAPIALCGISLGAAPSLTSLYQFSGGADGGSPFAPLVIGSGGVLYGTTLTGGSANGGTAFSLSPPVSAGAPWTETVLHSFVGGTDGLGPTAGMLLGPNGVLYGTTGVGGAANVGTVYSLTPPTVPGGPWTETILYTFTGPCGTPGTDGAGPAGTPVFLKGVMYGTTECGGTYGHGTVFALAPPTSSGGAWTRTILYSFAGNGDGATPIAGLVVGSGGVLYGTTSNGGVANLSCSAGCGTVFSLTPPTAPGGVWTEAVLYRFLGGLNPITPDGAYPYYGSLVIGAGGVLYGTTMAGGAYNSGIVFSLTPPASAGASWTEAILHNFYFQTGSLPFGGLVLSKAGILYGTTEDGGGTTGKAMGSVFQMTPPAAPGGAWKYAELYGFAYGGGGTFPLAAVTIGPNKTLYGTTSGSNLYGGAATVFALAL